MKLEEGLWLEGAYYLDRNQAGEVRVVGPGNHLYYGSTGLLGEQIKIVDVTQVEDGQIAATLCIIPPENFLPDPAMGHIRRIRALTQIFGRREPTYAQVAHEHPGELAPNRITSDTTGKANSVTYLRAYGEHYYGVRMDVPASIQLHRDDHRAGFRISGHHGAFEITLTTLADTIPEPYRGPLLKLADYDLRRLDPDWRTYAQELLDRTSAEIEHLVANGKTSGFDYGTLFPRDWIETADLIAEDLTRAALRYMYTETLRHINDEGVGWHEDIVGEFRYEREQELEHLSQNIDALMEPENPVRTQLKDFFRYLDVLFVTRQMIDIEPHYLLGLRFVPAGDFDAASIERLGRVAAFVAERAESQDLITFNKLAAPFKRQRGDEYYEAGNWRDSTLAFKQIHPVIAPFDVNVVFYPQALRVILEHHEILRQDPARIERLIAKWDRVRDWYRFTNPDGTSAYALALYDVRYADNQLHYDMLKVNNLDEAADLFYGTPSQDDVASFAARLLSPQYFYTPSGPILVGRGHGYDHTQYHGEVIWAKQAAYAIAGLERSLERGEQESWSRQTLDLIQSAIKATAESSLKAFRELSAIPELHYDDHGRARLYSDQEAPEGQMNKVQLWSAAAARRILQAYLPFVTIESSPAEADTKTK